MTKFNRNFLFLLTVRISIFRFVSLFVEVRFNSFPLSSCVNENNFPFQFFTAQKNDKNGVTKGGYSFHNKKRKGEQKIPLTNGYTREGEI